MLHPYFLKWEEMVVEGGTKNTEALFWAVYTWLCRRFKESGSIKEGGNRVDVFQLSLKEVEMREQIPTLTLPNLTC